MMRRSWILAGAFATLISLVAVGNAAGAVSAPAGQVATPAVGVAGPAADAGLEAMLRSASVPAAADTPGGPVQELKPVPVSTGSTPLSATASSCAPQAAKLAAGGVSAYNCATVVARNQAPASNESMAAAAQVAAPAVGAARPAADADLEAMLRSASVPAAADTPGGPVQELKPAPMSTGNTPLSATASSCAPQAAKLAAGEISAYQCAVVVAGDRSKTSSDGMAAAALPAACSSSNGAGTGWLATDRRTACNHEVFGIEIFEYATNKPPRLIGTTNMHATSTMTASTTTARWSHTKYMWVWGYTGVGFPSNATGRLFGCAGCVGTSSTWARSGTLGDAWRGTGNTEVTGLATDAIKNDVDGFWEATLTGTRWGNSVTVKLPIARSRCDNAVKERYPKPGCVFPAIPSVAAFSQTTVPQFTNHVYNAQLSGLPGRLNSGTYLTRITNPTSITSNGNRACPGSLTRPAGLQCDEYPFRSVQQGAFTSGSTVARSQPGCQMPDPARTGPTGWSRCFITGTQNGSAGGTLGNFYSRERMLTGDPFQVGYLP